MIERNSDSGGEADAGDGTDDAGEASFAELRAINEGLVLASVQQIELAEKVQQAQMGALATAQEEERRRLSRELHDQTGQHLTGLALGLKSLEETIRHYCPPETGATEALLHLQRAAAELARDIHRIAVDLRPTALDDLGLVAALESHIEQWSTGSGIPASFSSFGLDEHRLTEMGKITVYRVVQEALTNVARYATHPGAGVKGTTQVSVTLQAAHGYLQAMIEDDGPGFDEAVTQQHAGHLGIAGMRERAALCAGTLAIESAPGKGTTIYLRIPLV